MNEIHTNCMRPLVHVMESNREFHQLEMLEKRLREKEKKEEIPTFRHEALETKFCEHLEILCTYFRDYGELKDFFNTRRMLDLLKLEDWE